MKCINVMNFIYVTDVISSDEKSKAKVTVLTAKRKLDGEALSDETVIKKKDGRGRPKKDKRVEALTRSRLPTPVKTTSGSTVNLQLSIN